MPVKEETLREGNLFSSLMSNSLLISCLWEKACHMFWKPKDVCQTFRTPRGRGGLVDFWSCSLLKTREDESREATSKAQAIEAAHALHALSIPKEKEGGSERCCGRWSPLEWREMACKFSFSATVKSYVKKSKLRRITVTARH